MTQKEIEELRQDLELLAKEELIEILIDKEQATSGKQQAPEGASSKLDKTGI